MKKFRAFLLMTLVAFSIVSCEEKEIVPLEENVQKETSVQDILAAVQNVYSLDSFVESSENYRLTFHAPTPVTINGRSEVIGNLLIRKSLVESVTDGEKMVEVILSEGGAYSLRYESYVVFDFDLEPAIFSNDVKSISVPFSVKENSESKFDISVSGLSNFEAKVDVNGQSGIVTFETKMNGNFNETAIINVDNGVRKITYHKSLVMKSSDIDVNLSSMSFSFLEYARIFPIDLPQETNITVSIPSDCQDWISAKVGATEGNEKIALYVLLKENTSDSMRNGTLTLHCGEVGADINISQMGAGMDGSFKKALLDFYSALDGRNWFKRDGDDDDRVLHWNKNMSVVDFYGLFPSYTADASSIDPAQKETVYFGIDDRWQLYMPFNGLRGTIPESFWNVCKYFTYITINNCYLQNSTLSDKVWHENLEGLDLAHTYIGGHLSSSMARARNLEVVNLYKCRINGDFPKDISKLNRLKYINFKYCDFTGSLPEDIGNLSELTWFCIHGNLNLGGTLPDSFYELSKLQFFEACFTKIGGTLSPRIADMANLSSFDISCCEFEGIIPEELGTIKRFIFNGSGNYFTKLPEFVRYSGCAERWVLKGGTFPDGVPSYQRQKKDGRPKDLCSFDNSVIDEMSQNNYTDFYPLIFNERSGATYFDLPIWAHIRYNLVGWERYIVGTKLKEPEWPYAEDLQYPANEYYYDKDRKAWCHPKLEYPAREYYKDSRGNWVHDASCPWDQPYIYQD